jgi:hypothetical protein
MTWEERGRLYYVMRQVRRLLQGHPLAPDRATVEQAVAEMLSFCGKVYRYQKVKR